MFEMLAASGIVFWGLIALFVGSLLYSVENENGLQATVMLAIGLTIVWAIYDFNVITYTLANLQTVVKWTGIYFLTGLVWSVSKWYFFLVGAKNYLVNDKNVKFRYTSTTPEFYYRGNWQVSPPKFTDNKNRYMVWLMYWPASFIWTLINDPVRMAFEWIYENIGSSMQKISNIVFDGVEIKEKK